MTQTLLASNPYQDAVGASPWEKGRWPCAWIACDAAPPPPFVSAFRRRFAVESAAAVRVHVSADERYELYLDGQRVGRGSERGDADDWRFETYDLDLTAGEHTLVARVWSLGAQAPFAQMSVYPGFLLSPQQEPWIALLGTGVAPWEAKLIAGYAYTDPNPAWGTGANLILDGAQYPWGIERGEGDGWGPVVVRDKAADASYLNEAPPGHMMRPATLPPMLDTPRSLGTVRLASDFPGGQTHAIPVRQADHLPAEGEAWQALISRGHALTVPPHTRRRILLDLDDYVCAYPDLVVSGGAGARVRIDWQEALYDDVQASSKGDRNAVEGKFFVPLWQSRDGVGDTFLPDGGPDRAFTTLWWQCGRYVEVVVETQEAALTLESLGLRETRYPLEWEGKFDSSDPRLGQVIPLAVRVMQMCSHETYMDCPYYEQLMYVGDTRLEALTTYAMTRDDRLPRKALGLFDASRLRTGLTQSRYPSRVRQVIPPFSLWWVAMVHDYALWRDDPEFVRSLLPGVRAVMDSFLGCRNADGLVQAPVGWNYMDWVPAWESGIPPGGADGVSGVINAQFALVLTQVAQLEEWAGEPELAARARRLAGGVMRAVQSSFWDPARGMLADDLAHAHFSEHMQCLSILSGLLEPARASQIAQGLLAAPDLARTTIYFTHYLFETFYRLGRGDALQDRLSLWFDLTARGLKTTVEAPEPTRSDCHAWGAHPLFHFHASILGVRPAAPGFAQVAIAPQLGPLTQALGVLPHPRGEIVTSFTRRGDTLRAEITLPPDVTGTFHLGGNETPLHPGLQHIEESHT